MNKFVSLLALALFSPVHADDGSDITITWTNPDQPGLARIKIWTEAGKRLYDTRKKTGRGETYTITLKEPAAKCLYGKYYLQGSKSPASPLICWDDDNRDLTMAWPPPPCPYNDKIRAEDPECVAPPPPRKISIEWTAPTTNTDGSPLEDLAGFHIFCNDEEWGVYDPSVTRWRVHDSLIGEITCRVTAYDEWGNESTASEAVTFTR